MLPTADPQTPAVVEQVVYQQVAPTQPQPQQQVVQQVAPTQPGPTSMPLPAQRQQAVEVAGADDAP